MSVFFSEAACKSKMQNKVILIYNGLLCFVFPPVINGLSVIYSVVGKM
jgi:hypothetical protein